MSFNERSSTRVSSTDEDDEDNLYTSNKSAHQKSFPEEAKPYYAPHYASRSQKFNRITDVSLKGRQLPVQQNAKLTTRLAKTKEKYITIKSLISHPICCGYLKEFCISQYNEESLNFVLQVDEIRDLFLIDKIIWTHDWRELDSQVISFECENNLRPRTRTMKFCEVDNDLKCLYKDGVWVSLADEMDVRNRIKNILEVYIYIYIYAYSYYIYIYIYIYIGICETRCTFTSVYI
jgi:hypothetical protein